eukprot:437796-Rhodomonas_salina.3
MISSPSQTQVQVGDMQRLRSDLGSSLWSLVMKPVALQLLELVEEPSLRRPTSSAFGMYPWTASSIVC